jgi:hypothetical protein
MKFLRIQPHSVYENRTRFFGLFGGISQAHDQPGRVHSMHRQ